MISNSSHPYADLGEPQAVPGVQPEPVEPARGLALDPLPPTISIPAEFANRIPTQRVLDSLAQIEAAPLAELMATQATRIIAYRALLRDYPERDPTSLWMHAYDVEIEILTADPTDGPSPTRSPPSAVTGE